MQPQNYMLVPTSWQVISGSKWNHSSLLEGCGIVSTVSVRKCSFLVTWSLPRHHLGLHHIYSIDCVNRS